MRRELRYFLGIGNKNAYSQLPPPPPGKKGIRKTETDKQTERDRETSQQQRAVHQIMKLKQDSPTKSLLPEKDLNSREFQQLYFI